MGGATGCDNGGGYGGGHDNGELWWHDKDIKPVGSDAWEMVESLLIVGNVSGRGL